MRVAPPRVFGDAARAPRPALGAPGADAHRQTGFVLAEDLEQVIGGLALEGRIAGSLAGAGYRRHPVAASLGIWSRAWLTRLAALHAAEVGNYVAAMPLLRAATDYLAAKIAFLRTAAAEWQEWLDGQGVAQAPSQHALQFELHPFRSAETMAGHQSLGEIYRTVTDFTLPHFGSTLALVAGDSDENRIAITFGDRDFHLAWAELVLGWLMELGSLHLQAVVEESGPSFMIHDALSHELRQFLAESSERPRAAERCRVETLEIDGLTRYVVHNYRRVPGGAPSRLLL